MTDYGALYREAFLQARVHSPNASPLELLRLVTTFVAAALAACRRRQSWKS